MDDEQRFDHYRLTFLESLPDSEWKHALIKAIKQKVHSRDADPQDLNASRRKNPPDSGTQWR
jgi:hypothetical protein